MNARPAAQAAAVLAATVAAFVLVSVVRGDDAAAPELRFEQDVPADVRMESDAVWSRFRQRFDGRMGCINDATVVLERSVEGGDARYVSGDERIEIRIPTTPERFRESLAHELAHHVERSCPAFATLQEQLEPLLSDGAGSWSTGPTWDAIPSERYAEAVVELVNGERVRHVDTVPVDQGVVALIERWGGAPDPAS